MRKHLRVALLLSPLVVVACSSDSSSDGAAGAGASGASGTSGTAGTAGTAGAAGSGGTSGAGGTSGSSGAAGQGGAAGTSGTAGAAGAGGSAGTAGGAGNTCGNAPLVNVTGTITSYTSATTKVVGGKLTVDVCPDLTITTDADGKLDAKLSKGVAYNPRIEAEGYITSRTGEQILQADYDASSGLLSDFLTGVIPSWSTNSPSVLAAAQFSASPAPQPDPNDPCTSLDGVVFAVTDHPEAVVTYFQPGSIPTADPSLTSTSTLGLAAINGLSENLTGALIEITATKAGCDVSFDSYPHTGRYRLENGVLTFAGAFMPPVTAP